MNRNCILLFGMMSLLSCGTTAVKKNDQPTRSAYLKKVYYDGVTDDLLTSGLGKSGLQGPPPALSEKPSAKELRRSSYYNQFKALNDLTDDGGFGHLYGISSDQKPVAGHEYWAQRSLGDGVYHTVVLQIPDGFSNKRACLVIAPSSGSRNVFGAVGTSGAWALMRGCAVVYTDKGTGTIIALTGNQTYQIDGTVVDQSDQTILKSKRKLSTPSDFHVVQQHPYSKANPEQFWGEFVLDAAVFGLAQLQAERNTSRDQVKVIAASLSNGGGAVLRAAEKDSERLIDAVVAAEPQVNLRHKYSLKLNEKEQTIQSKPLLELSVQLSLFEPCAALHESLNTAPFKANTILLQSLLGMRCQALADAGLINGDDLKQQAAAALAEVKSLNIESEALQLAQINTLAGMWAAINHTYSNSYLKMTAADNLCQSAMSAFTVAGAPRVLTETEKLNMFALSNGIAPSNGVELAYTNVDNQIQSRMMLAPNFGLSSQMCFQKLSQTPAFKAAITTVMSAPEKNQLPTIILHGQADGTVAINHSSRAYFHHNQSFDKPNKDMRYYEIKHAQHFDAFLSFPGFKEQFVPMHPYFEQALEMMLMHLRSGDDLPPSQVVETRPRGVTHKKLTDAHVPAIKLQPKKHITVTEKQLVIQ